MNTVHTILDLSYLELMSDGDGMMKKTMLDMLIEEMPPELEKLRVAFLASDAAELHQVAHKMKSTLAFVGNEPMTVANATIEDIAKEATNLQRIGSHLDTLEKHAPEVLAALQTESDRLA